MTNYKNVPVLRFKEFESEWEVTAISKTLSIGSGRDYKHLENGKIPVYGSGGYMLSVNKYLHEGESVCIGRKGTIDKPIYLNEKFWTVDTLFYTHTFINTIPYFVFLLFNRINWYKYNEASGVPSLSKSTISKIKINLPTKPEQQKIANFLTATDTKIQQLRQKKGLLNDYKKGVMQQIFKQEIRFKNDDGGDFEDWEVKRLGEVTKYYDGTHQTPKYTETGIPFYSVEHLTRNNFSKTKFISEEVFHKENKRVKLEKGDILMTRIGDIGTSKLIIWDVRASFYVSLALIKQSENFDSAYLNQFIQSDFFQKELYKRTIHVAFPKKINLGEIGKCFVKLPQLEEQQKIANFLSSIDERIGKISEEIGEMERYKKGLLQGMFV
jgi:type I restriction enzyme S subunit